MYIFIASSFIVLYLTVLTQLTLNIQVTNSSSWLTDPRKTLYLLEVGNPVDNIEDYEEGRETLQEELVNSVNTRQ